MKYTEGVKKGGFFEGYWVNDKRQGHGKIIYNDKNYYSFEGEYQNDIDYGKGIKKYENLDKELFCVEEGFFKDGKLEGRPGIIKMYPRQYKDREIKYECNFINGVPEGYGKCINYIEGDGKYIYEGNFHNYFENGKGVRYYLEHPHVSRIEGNFKDGRMNGNCNVYYKNGIIKNEFFY